MIHEKSKFDQSIISSWIIRGATVLDLGCGDGELLSRLISEKQVSGQGIELNERAIRRCVASGLSVIQQDLDTGLAEYGDKSFDYVILNQTLQQVRKPDLALKEALRVGGRVIVGFPNFCYIWDRFQIFFHGRVPVTPSLPYQWYDTPNLHFLSIADFLDYCSKRNLKILQSTFFRKNEKTNFLPNLLAENGLFLITKAS